MEKPKQPFKSSKYICLPEHETKILDSKTYVYPECIERWIESQEDYDNYCNNNELPAGVHEWHYDTDLYTLQDLLDLAKGKDPKDVIISLSRDREIIHVGISVEHRTQVDIQAWQAAHDAEEDEYQRKYAEYIEADKKYQLYLAEQELEKLVSKITHLKG